MSRERVLHVVQWPCEVSCDPGEGTACSSVVPPAGYWILVGGSLSLP